MAHTYKQRKYVCKTQRIIKINTFYSIYLLYFNASKLLGLNVFKAIPTKIKFYLSTYNNKFISVQFRV